ncbi:MAG: hypothetical protein ACT4P7_19625 [Gemmatimonadaceae bacterium]
MAQRAKYRKKAGSYVVAVQLNLQTRGFHYEKWGGSQTGKAGDWLLDNNGDVYTVDRDTFARTYQPVSPGLYRKVAPVWAELAERDGSIPTKEGVTHYRAGAYLVFNEPDGRDGYAVEAEAFHRMYEADKGE